MENTVKEGKNYLFVSHTAVVDIKEIAREILGENYSFLYHFFHNFIDNTEFDYKFVKTRRAYVLFLIFKDIIESEPKFERSKQWCMKIDRIFTDVYVESGQYDISNKTKILVIDDILIYGRAITQFLIQLIRDAKYSDDETERICIDVIARCQDIKKYKDILIEHMTGKIQPDKFENNVIQIAEELWKDLSNRIVKLILTLGYDYTAFSDSLVVHNNPFEEYPDSFDIPPLAIQESAESKFGVSILKNQSLNSIEKYSIILRGLYSNQKGKNRYRVQDYCILPMFEINEWSYIIANSFGVNIDVNKELFDDVSINDGTAYKLYKKGTNAFIYYYKCFAYIIGINSLNNIKGNQDILLNLCGRYSFGFDSLEQIKNINQIINCYTRSTDSINILKKEKSYVLNDAAKMWEKIVKDHNHFSPLGLSEAFEKFIKRLHEENEERAKANREKLQGIFIQDLVWILEEGYRKWRIPFEEKKQIPVFLGIVFNFCDNGLATCNVDILVNKSDQKTYIGYCITDGEQACRAGSDNGCLIELKSLNYIKRYTKNGEEFDVKVRKFIEKIKEKNISEVNLSKISKIKDYFEDNPVVEGAISAYKYQPLPDQIVKVLSAILV